MPEMAIKTDPGSPQPSCTPQPRTTKRKSTRLLCVDFVEDRNRSRLVALFICLALYLVVGSELIRQGADEKLETVGRLVISSGLPSRATLGPYFSDRAPGVKVVSTSGTSFATRRCPLVTDADRCDPASARYVADYKEPVTVALRVADLKYDNAPAKTLNCASDVARSLAGTLEALRVADACTPVLAHAINATNDDGLAIFPALAVTSGPSARYTVELSAGDGVQVNAEVVLESAVNAIVVTVSGGGLVAQPGVPIPTQPSVKVVDANGAPLANRTVVVWSSEVPNIFRADSPQRTGFTGQDVSDEGKLKAYIRGQSIALLKGTRAVTDGDGIATWSDLTITAASSRCADARSGVLPLPPCP